MAPSSSADGRGHRPEGRKSPRRGRGTSPSLQRGEHVTFLDTEHPCLRLLPDCFVAVEVNPSRADSRRDIPLSGWIDDIVRI